MMTKWLLMTLMTSMTRWKRWPAELPGWRIWSRWCRCQYDCSFTDHWPYVIFYKWFCTYRVWHVGMILFPLTVELCSSVIITSVSHWTPKWSPRPRHTPSQQSNAELSLSPPSVMENMKHEKSIILLLLSAQSVILLPAAIIKIEN